MMKKSSSIANDKGIFLLIIIFLSIVFSYFHQQGIRLSDQYLYSKNAYLLSIDQFELTPSVFNNRFGVILPTSVLIKLFGFNYYVVTLWPLFSLIYLILCTYFFTNKYAPHTTKFTLILLASSPLLLKLSADLLPDLIMASFTTVAVYILYDAKYSKSKKEIKALVFILSFFVATLSKETTIFIAPFFLFFFIYDVYQRKNLKFWIWVFLLTFLLGTVYLFIYYIKTGDILYRVHGIEKEHNASDVWSFHNSSYSELIERLTIGPVMFLFTSIYFCYLVILTIYSFGNSYFKKIYKLELEDSSVFIGLYLLYLLLIHWLGSTSFNSFNPLPLLPRMWILLLPPLCMLSAKTLAEKMVENQQKRKLFLVIVFLMILFSVYSFIQSRDFKLLFSVYYRVVFFLYYIFIQKITFKIFSTAFFAPVFLYLIAFALIFHKERSSYFHEENLFRKIMSKYEDIRIIADPKLAKYYDVYFNFNPPNNVSVTNWYDTDPESLGRNGFFLWNNISRNEEIGNRYDKKYPVYIIEIIKENKPKMREKDIEIYCIE